MVGDTKYDAQGAAETGVDFIGCLYGYGTREEMENFYKNAVYASSPAEIRDIIIWTVCIKKYLSGNNITAVESFGIPFL